jgi:hypothetical protein
MSTGGKRRIFQKAPGLQRQVFRNMTWNILKNFTVLELALYVPLHLLNLLLMILWAALPGTGLSLTAALRGYIVDPLLHLRWIKARRATVQVRPWYDCRLLREALRGGWTTRPSEA